MGKVTLGNEEVTVAPFMGRKALRAMRILRDITKGSPTITNDLSRYIREYEASHALLLDRTQARFRFPEQTKHLTDEDWAAHDNTLTLPQSPSQTEQFMAMFPALLDLAEEQVLNLMALAVVSDAEIERRFKENGKDGITDLLHERGDELLGQARAEELLELAVVTAETVQEQFEDKIKDLGGRLGNLRRLLNLEPAQPTPSTDSTKTKQEPTSSTDSPAPTDGANDEPSTEPIGDDSSSLSSAKT